MGDDLFMSNMEIALVVLLSGLVIVFAVLFLLIGIVKGYGMIVLTVTGKREAKRKEKAERAKAAAKAAQQVTNTIDSLIAAGNELQALDLFICCNTLSCDRT